MSLNNYRIEKELGFSRLSAQLAKAISENSTSKAAIVQDVTMEKVRNQGEIVYDKLTDSTYVSTGVSWKLIGRRPIESIGSGIEVVNVTSGTRSMEQSIDCMRTLKSSEGTIDISLLPDSTINIDIADSVLNDRLAKLDSLDFVTGDGNVLYANTPNIVRSIPIGNEGDVLTSFHGTPAWKKGVNLAPQPEGISTVDTSNSTVTAKELRGERGASISESDNVITISSQAFNFENTGSGVGVTTARVTSPRTTTVSSKTFVSDGTMTIQSTPDSIVLGTSLSHLLPPSQSGSVFYTDINGSISQLPPSTSQGQYLKLSDGMPGWSDLPPIPENNGIVTVGEGVSIYKGIVNNNHQFKSVSSSSTITVNDNSDGTVSMSTSLNALVPELVPGSVVYVNESSNVDTLSPGEPNNILIADPITGVKWSSIQNAGDGVPLFNEDNTVKTLTSNGTIGISSLETGEIELSTSLSSILGTQLPDKSIITTENGMASVLLPGNPNQVLTSTSQSFGWADPIYPPSTSRGVGVNVNIPREMGAYEFKSFTSDGTVSLTPTEDTIELSTTLSKIVPDTQPGDLLVKGDSDFTPLNVGPRKYVLTSNGNSPVWMPSQSGSSPTTLIVRKNPSEGEFSTIFDAMNSIPEGASTEETPWIIKVSSGRYIETQTIHFKPFTYVVGEDIGGVIIEPQTEGYDLFVFNRATALSFCSLKGVSSPNYACVFTDTGTTGFEYALMHKVNVYSSKMLVNTVSSGAYAYFEYCSYAQTHDTDSIDIAIDVVSNNDFEAYLSVENHFVQGIFTIAAVRIGGPNAIFYGQLCNFEGTTQGDGVLVTNGGQVDIRTSYFGNFKNALHLDLIGSNPRLTSSGSTFGDNQINLNVKNPTASGYLFGSSEYSKTLINPMAYGTFFISGSNPRILTVAPKGAKFSSIYAALNAINPVVRCTTSTGSEELKSDNLFNIHMTGVEIVGEGIQPGTTCTFVDESTILLSLPATASVVTELTFIRATEYTAYTILVQPGFYVEQSPMMVGEYINISGVNRDTCVCIPGVPDTSLFVISSHASISNLNIMGVSPMMYAVIFTDSMFSFADNIVFYQIGNAISFQNQTISYVAEVRNCLFVDGSGANAISINNTNSQVGLTVTLSDLRCYQHYDSFFDVKGVNTVVVIRNCALVGDSNGDVMHISESPRISMQGVYIERWARGIVTTDITTLSPYLAIEGLTNTLISGHILDIQNPSISGYYSGHIPHNKISITDESQFFVCNKDSKIITVAKKGGDYTSIHDAIESIQGASTSNIYTIIVGPGIFVEPPLIMKSFTNLRGTGYMSTVIFCNDASNPVITGADSSNVTGFTFNGATSDGGCAVYFEGTGTAPGSPFIVENCILGSNHTLISVRSEHHPAVMILNQCLYGATFDADEGVRVVGVGGQMAYLLVYNCVFQDLVTPVPQTLMSCDGDNALLVAANTMIQLNGTNTSSALKMRNGAGVRIYGCSVVGLETGVISENVGNGPGLIVSSSSFESCERILVIENPYTTGYFAGSIEINKVYIHPQSTFNVRERVTNTLVVSEMGADYTSIHDAIQTINPTYVVSILSGSVNVDATNVKFNPSIDGFTVTGSGIPPNTTIVYVSGDRCILSNPIDASLLTVTAVQTNLIDLTIVRSSPSNPYVVYLQPGVYHEPSLTIPPYVSLEGVSKTGCIVQSSSQTNTSPVIIMGRETSVSKLTIIGNSQSVGILIDSTNISDSDLPVELRNIVVRDCQQGIFATASQGKCKVKGECVLIAGHCAVGMLVDGASLTSPHQVNVVFSDLNVRLESPSHTSVICEGPNATLIVNSTVIDCSSLATTTGVSISDGCTMLIGGSHILNTTLDGLIVHPDGDGPMVQCTGSSFYNNVSNDIHIQHPQTNGCLAMVTAQASKVDIVEGCPITVSFVDSVENGVTLLGDVNIGRSIETKMNIYPLLTTQTVGVIDGGVIAVSSGASINIGHGNGYVFLNDLKYVAWPDTTLSLPDRTEHYIHVSPLGSVVSLASKHTSLDYLYLGRCVCENGSVAFVENIAMISKYISNAYDDFHRTALGPVVSSGLKVTVDINRYVSVSSGVYFLSGVKLVVDTLSEFVVYSHLNGGLQFTNTPIIDNLTYDTLTDVAVVNDGWYTRHSVWVCDGRAMIVMAQSQFPTEEECVDSPIPPSYFRESIIHIADVVTHQSDNTFSKIIDCRPIITSSISSVASTLVHSNLQGLMSDDHPQYLLADGTRPISGTLNLGNNPIVAVSNINGVDYSRHAARHLPNGQDPLATGVPVSVSGSTTNYEGIANSFSRSDHTHRILTGTVVTQSPDQLNSEGSSQFLARADHIHNIPADIAIDISTSNKEGTSSSFSRSDHTHLGVRSLQQFFGDVSILSGNGVNVTSQSNTIKLSTTVCANEFIVSIGTGLQVLVTSGRVISGMTSITIPQTTITLPGSSSGVVFVDASGVKTRTGNVFGRNECPIAFYTTSSSSVISVTDARTTIGIQTANVGIGGLLVVDSVYGHNLSAGRGGSPYLTIDAALQASTSGDVVFVNPGTYSSSGLIVPSGVSLVGVDRKRCVISLTPTTSVTGITLNANSAVGCIRLDIASSTSSTLLTGVLFSDGASNNSRIHEMTITISNTSTTETNIYGVRSNDSIVSNGREINVESTSIVVASSGTAGVVRGMLCDSACVVGCADVSVTVNSPIGIGVEVRNNGTVRMRGCEVYVTTPTLDYLRTLGTIDLIGSTQTSYGSHISHHLVSGDRVFSFPDTSDTLLGSKSVLTSTYLKTLGGSIDVSSSSPQSGYVLTATSDVGASWMSPIQLSPGTGIDITGSTISNAGIIDVGSTDGTIVVSKNNGIVNLSTPFVSGSGISILGNTISSSGVLGITSDSTILVGGTSSNPVLSANYLSGTGISIDNGVITNTSPASSLSLSSAGGTYSIISSGFSLKGLTPGAGIILGANSLGITISNASPASSVTLSNAGSSSSVSIVSRGTGPGVTTKGLVAGSGVTLVSGSTDITISASGISNITAGNNTITVSGTPTNPVISGGYVGGSGVTISGNTISASGVVNVSSGNNTILVGGTVSNPTVTGNYIGGTGVVIIGNVITNSSPATGVYLSSVGLSPTTQSIVSGATGPSLSVKGIASGAGISVSSTASDVVVSNTGVISVSPGNGIAITGTSNPTISSAWSRPQLSFCAPDLFSADLSFKAIAHFSWLQSMYASLTSGMVIYSVRSGTVSVRVYNVTTSTVLGSDTGSSVGVRSFSFTNPSVDSIIEIQMTSSNSGVISGLQWSWNS